MSARAEIQAIKKRAGMGKRRMLFGWAYGYNDAGEMVYEMQRGCEQGLTEAELRSVYPEDWYDLHLVAMGVTDGNGDEMLDDKGRPQLVDFRGL